MQSTQTKAAIDILRSWHRVEFFQPYTVPDSDDYNIVKISMPELLARSDSLMPWLNPARKHQLNIPADAIVIYTLYLGLFNKGELNRIVERQLGRPNDDVAFVEADQRSDNEGFTCYARLDVDQFGVPNFADMSVSTLPWAMGHLMQNALDQLSHDAFEQRCVLLQESVDRLALTLPTDPQGERRVLDGPSLKTLLNMLFQWANYEPVDDVFAVGLGWRVLEKQRNGKPENILTHQPIHKITIVASAQKEDGLKGKGKGEGEGEGEDERMPDEYSMPILNSFYLEDIERAVNGFQRGEVLGPLAVYLSSNVSRHPDLYTKAGLARIVDQLTPGLTPTGRWPSDPHHNMSLMQQYAVNTAARELADGGILSVNGPPGTGKTTLLRDIVAKNIVDRAKVLADFNHAAEGLTDQGYPIAALLGFDMVVASSNNAAVENISKELPQLNAICDEFSDLSYFSPVANYLAAKRSKGTVAPLSDSNVRWGLVAAITGKKLNREKLIDRLFIKNHHLKGSDAEKHRPSGEDFLTFWGFKRVEHAKLPSFQEAKARFNAAMREYECLNHQIEAYATLLAEHQDKTLEGYIEPEKAEQQQQEQSLERLAKSIAQQRSELEIINEQLEIADLNLSNERSTLQAEQAAENPSWWRRLLNRFRGSDITETDTIRAMRGQVIQLQEGRLAHKQKLAALESQYTQMLETRANTKLQIARKRQQFKRDSEALAAFKIEFSDMATPSSQDAIESHSLQRNALWQNATINRLRSAVFVAAMHLHQSWLLDACSGNGPKAKAFRENSIFRIIDLLRGRAVHQPRKVWGTLFLIVPVLSTTFASLRNQFKALGPGDIGWMLIDEAGQATPQAAVGALLRAKRALVVGDPLQIEPVLPTSPKLVEYLSQQILGDRFRSWAPNLTSVQQLSDRINPYGCMLTTGETAEWIGIPLWVHRRCIDPMFSVSNRIAYNMRMVHGKSGFTSKDHPALGPNTWFDVKGECVKKQFVPAHTDVLLNLLSIKLHADGDLKDLYIITPFKAIKTELKKMLGTFPLQACWNRRRHQDWVRNNIGTIHTFQGKENQVVIMVLGCSEDNQGGAAWAAEKPNLLNVAITRAKQNIYIIGDTAVWGHRAYFNSIRASLRVIKYQARSAGARHSTAQPFE